METEEEEELKLKAENKIIATSKDSVDESDIPNLAKEINETIQKEIAGLPSQKLKPKQIGQKLNEIFRFCT